MSTEESTSPIDNFYRKDLATFIVPKNGLLTDVKKSKAVDLIYSELIKIPNFQNYKQDLEFLRMACNFVENMIVKKDGVNKLDVIIDVFIKLFGLNPVETVLLKTSVEFLLNNKRIKKIKIVKKVGNYISRNLKGFF